MKVLVVGGSGFTGSHLVRRLASDPEASLVRCLRRKTSSTEGSPSGIEWVEGDLDDVSSVTRALDGVDVLYYVASLGFGHAPNVIKAMSSAGVLRGVFTSTTGVFTTLSPPSKAVRLEAERCLMESNLKATILRPTMIFGTESDRNMCRLLRFLKRSPIIPVFGSGKYLQQPVYVEDLVSALIGASRVDETIGQAYNVSGGEALTFNEVIDTACRLMGRKVLKVHLPMKPVVGSLRVAEKLPLPLPVKSEQILRLNEDKSFCHGEAVKDFGYAPLTFEEAIRREIEGIGWYEKPKSVE